MRAVPSAKAIHRPKGDSPKPWGTARCWQCPQLRLRPTCPKLYGRIEPLLFRDLFCFVREAGALRKIEPLWGGQSGCSDSFCTLLKPWSFTPDMVLCLLRGRAERAERVQIVELEVPRTNVWTPFATLRFPRADDPLTQYPLTSTIVGIGGKTRITVRT